MVGSCKGNSLGIVEKFGGRLGLIGELKHRSRDRQLNPVGLTIEHSLVRQRLFEMTVE
jgi:hypothetical protein